mmetsp:Transcript_30586/g.69852  ORF Transcript_30586/g.69852 Transcript_30586/m.69852 type:complete len:83 (+) Transcript_30586:787-1035(+)
MTARSEINAAPVLRRAKDVPDLSSHLVSSWLPQIYIDSACPSCGRGDEVIADCGGFDEGIFDGGDFVGMESSKRSSLSVLAT